jgi:protoporphyrinogen oxidase
MSEQTMILGAGLAGLSAAYHSGYPVFEMRHRPGGAADSISEQGFVFDLGIHVLQSREPYFLKLLEVLGVSLVTHKRNAWIFSNGSYSLYPFQVNISHLPWGLRLQCVLGFLLRERDGQPGNYEEWIIRNFGQGFAENFLIPYARKFWRVAPSEMTYEWTGERVPQPRLVDILKGMFRDQDTNMGTNTYFQYPTAAGAGFGAIAAALASKIEPIAYGHRATFIDPVRRVIHFNGGEIRRTYDHLISTIPLPELFRIIPDAPSHVLRAVHRLAFNSIAIVNLAVDRPQVSDKHWVHFPGGETPVFRMSFPGNFCQGLNPEGTSTLQAEISYDRKDRPDRDDLLRQVRADLVRFGVLRGNDRMLFEDVVFQEYGYVIYDHAREEALREIQDYLKRVNIHTCGRYGEWKYLWSDQSVLSGKRAAQRIVREKSRTPVASENLV